MEANQAIKFTVVGSGATGKTCLCIRYHSRKFPNLDYTPRIKHELSERVDFNGTTRELRLCDTGSNLENYCHLLPLSYHGTHIFFICYAVDDLASLQDVENKWYPVLTQHYPEALVYLIGTKGDLRIQAVNGAIPSDIVNHKVGSDLAKRLRLAGYMECSALTGEGVDEVFNKAVEELVQHLIQKRKKEKEQKCVIC